MVALRRVLLKISGEALAGEASFGIMPDVLERVALEIKEGVKRNTQLGLVIGGGNLFRGGALREAGLDRVTGDQMGMLATLMNAIALGDVLTRQTNLKVRILSATPVPALVETYRRTLALDYLEDGYVVIFATGTGNPLFTTDTAACLRGIEMNADLVLKATRVDGVYTADPEKVPDAQLISHLTYQQALAEQIGVMDQTAIALCQTYDMSIRIFNMNREGALTRLIQGEAIGTLISGKIPADYSGD